MTANELITKYQKIWDKYISTDVNVPTNTAPSNLLDRGFTFQFDEDLKQADILFVGINPSYQIDSPSVFHSYTKPGDSLLSYFNAFHKMEQRLIEEPYNRKISWTHVDLLVMRETQQSYISTNLFKTEIGLQFIMEQLSVAREIIEYLKPKVIVVSNTMARELLGRNRQKLNDDREVDVWMDYQFEFDTDIGTDKVISEGDLNGTPVFFTSMLSGQRALDRGTFQRLVWHVDRVLGNDLA